MRMFRKGEQASPLHQELLGLDKQKQQTTVSQEHGALLVLINVTVTLLRQLIEWTAWLQLIACIQAWHLKEHKIYR